ncbi:hypothetical protein [Dyadobacter jiangsuensis]|uniref:Uncharacterized protein n=1 Tax=Dyadobacter jiangsuensis TaxID=1591085 RepID=A0A2P8FVG4_9BACT|nr:hypothetical protein [Dyadobacter jiangsuensis]PSL25711.1 hypothetical protein CLV60_111162 [Dyadobacter jiangsuensis]
METVKVIIGKGKGLYGAYSENAPGIWGEGSSVAEVKRSFKEAIELYIEYNEPGKVPAILSGEYDLKWEFEEEGTISG